MLNKAKEYNIYRTGNIQNNLKITFSKQNAFDGGKQINKHV